MFKGEQISPPRACSASPPLERWPATEASGLRWSATEARGAGGPGRSLTRPLRRTGLGAGRGPGPAWVRELPAAVLPAGLHRGCHPQDGGVSTGLSAAGISPPTPPGPGLPLARNQRLNLLLSKTRGRLIVVVNEITWLSEKSSGSSGQQKAHVISDPLMPGAGPHPPKN